MASITRVHPVSTPTFPVNLGASAEDVIFVEIDYLAAANAKTCLLYTSPSPRDRTRSRMPSSA